MCMIFAQFSKLALTYISIDFQMDLSYLYFVFHSLSFFLNGLRFLCVSQKFVIDFKQNVSLNYSWGRRLQYLIQRMCHDIYRNASVVPSIVILLNRCFCNLCYFLNRITNETSTHAHPGRFSSFR